MIYLNKLMRFNKAIGFLIFAGFITPLFSSPLLGQTLLKGILPEVIMKEGRAHQLETKAPRGGFIWAMDWSPNDKYLAVGSMDGHVRIYDAQTLQLMKILAGHSETVDAVNWSPSGNYIASTGHDATVRLWDLASNSAKVLKGHTAQVRNVKWSPDGSNLASGGHDGTLRIWNKDGDSISVATGAPGYVGIDWHPSGKFIATSCWDNTVRIYKSTGEHLVTSENGKTRFKAVLSVDWHPSGAFFATGDYGNETDPESVVKFWSKSGELLKELRGHTMEIRSLAWSPDGKYLATGGEDVRIWNEEGKLVNFYPEIAIICLYRSEEPFRFS